MNQNKMITSNRPSTLHQRSVDTAEDCTKNKGSSTTSTNTSPITTNDGYVEVINGSETTLVSTTPNPLPNNSVEVINGSETTHASTTQNPLSNNYVEVINGSETSYHQVQDNSKLGLPNL